MFSFGTLTDTVAGLVGTIAVTPQRLLLAGAITVAFAVIAKLARSVTTSGALVGWAMSFVLFVCGGPTAFAALATVFLLTLLSTRFGYRQKQELGTAERRTGRTGSQVTANLLVATAASAASLFPAWRSAALMASVAALAEAAADTVSSEFGQSINAPVYLITNWKIVVPGTDGGISLPGTLAGIIASFTVGVVCAATHLLTRGQTPVAVTAGVLGMFTDSYLGALFERRKLLGNDKVNFLSTLIAAAIAVGLSLVVR